MEVSESRATPGCVAAVGPFSLLEAGCDCTILSGRCDTERPGPLNKSLADSRALTDQLNRARTALQSQYSGVGGHATCVVSPGLDWNDLVHFEVVKARLGIIRIVNALAYD